MPPAIGTRPAASTSCQGLNATAPGPGPSIMPLLSLTRVDDAVAACGDAPRSCETIQRPAHAGGPRGGPPRRRLRPRRRGLLGRRAGPHPAPPRAGAGRCADAGLRERQGLLCHAAGFEDNCAIRSSARFIPPSRTVSKGARQFWRTVPSNSTGRCATRITRRRNAGIRASRASARAGARCPAGPIRPAMALTGSFTATGRPRERRQFAGSQKWRHPATGDPLAETANPSIEALVPSRADLFRPENRPGSVRTSRAQDSVGKCCFHWARGCCRRQTEP